MEGTPCSPPLGRSGRFGLGPSQTRACVREAPPRRALVSDALLWGLWGAPHLLPFSDPHGPPPAHERRPVPAAALGGLTFLRVGTLSHCWVPRARKRASQAGAPKIVEKEKRERKKDYGLSQQGRAAAPCRQRRCLLGWAWGRGLACPQPRGWGELGGGASITAVL